MREVRQYYYREKTKFLLNKTRVCETWIPQVKIWQIPYILTRPHPQGHVKSVKCDKFTTKVWLLHHHSKLKYLWQANVDKNRYFLIFKIHFLIFENHFLIFKIHFLIFIIRTIFKY